jgi:alpha-mannosidase
MNILYKGTGMMDKKQLYMIGNSHIDPVWFWDWDEGMQEVKATFQSALDRMNEFPDFKFSCTSTAFFEWIKKIDPELFEEIKKRVREGRWEITGGWFIEPDCLLPSGESFVRQGLYGQRFLQENFGKTAHIGSNVDSFGHAASLPQILKKSDIDSYVFMRPRQSAPMFIWESADGSRVRAISLPGEYTTWFHDPTVENIRNTIARSEGFDKMVCCYGVGNHGGGPTIDNIHSIQKLQQSYQNAELHFATYEEFLADTKDYPLMTIESQFEKINLGCYSIDSELKRLNRVAEKRLMEADTMMAMSHLSGNPWLPETENIAKLWKIVLFNTFHDLMGGTIIKSATKEGEMQLGGAAAEAKAIIILAMQQIANRLDNRGEGTPIVLFNPTSSNYHGEIELELDWFCKAELRLMDPKGREIPYQRIHTDAKVRNWNIGGRRRFLFCAEVPAMGYAVYRAEQEMDSLGMNKNMEIPDPDTNSLENAYIRAEFDQESGALTALIDKTTGYNALNGGSSIRVYIDERDCWGDTQGRRYEPTDGRWKLVSMRKVESGGLRSTIRVRMSYEQSRIELLYSLGVHDRALRLEGRLMFGHTWTLLKLGLPITDCEITEAEIPYGTYVRRIAHDDTKDYNMHRFLDVRAAAGCGLLVVNDSKYAFNLDDGLLGLTLVRSSIIAQGNGREVLNDIESYEYTDQGYQTFRFRLMPHGEKIGEKTMYQEAALVQEPILVLADSAHPGAVAERTDGFLHVDADNVVIPVMKKAEEGEALIVRLLETEGRDTECNLTVMEKTYHISIGHAEIKTLRIDEDGCISETELTELR